jgi:two-component sensor histidine kinase/PAS domain-containing protein
MTGSTFASAGLAEALVQTIDLPLLILHADLVVGDANPAFCELFQVDLEATRGRPLYELGDGRWDIAELRRLLEQILPERRVIKGYRVEREFPGIGRRVMILNARRIAADQDRPELILLVIADRTEAEQASFELEGHREFQGKLIDSIRESLLVLDHELKVVQANQTFYETFAVSPAETERRLIYQLGNGQWKIPRLRHLLERVLPQNNAFDDVEVDHDFEVIGRRIMLLNGRRLDHMDLILLAIRDVTEQRRLEAQQQLLMGELHHRINNVLTNVQALASQTLRQYPSIEDFGAAFQGRLQALARAQEMLVKAPERHVDITELLRLELCAQGAQEGRSFALTGPEVALSPEAAQAFAMAIHELTTNAVKHGALAAPDGRVEIIWERFDGDGGSPSLRFRWRERGLEIDTTPARIGYGSRVLKTTFRHALRGESQLILHPDGAELLATFEVT